MSAAATLPVTLRRAYDQQMRAWFGEVRPLRLEGAGRFFTPPPALPMRAIFVPPALSASQLGAGEQEPSAPDAADILQWLERRHRLVVLGDPGSGKSTLVAWLCWRLCAGLTEPLPAWCNGVLPVPLVLRDLRLQAPLDFMQLLDAMLDSPMISSQTTLQRGWGEALRGLLDAGGAELLFLVDGLDELANSLRVPVRDALRDAMRRWPQARFVVTSRIVGYDDCPVDEPAYRHAESLLLDRSADLAANTRSKRPPPPKLAAALPLDVQRLHVMPFDAGRIRQFAAHWFAHGETLAQRGQDLQQRFVTSLLRDPVALQLARIPNLLVMAAQVFGISNTLPDGRARLYEAITKAYLESIEQRYGLADARYSFEQKKAWLAALGHRMQARRDSGDPAAPGAVDGRDLLVDEADVVDWLAQAMQESGLAPDEDFVRGFVDAIARRSGLFVPRGEGLYAFSHLSIQEYFAALHLQAGMRDLPVVDTARYQALLQELGERAGQPHWRETLITFFELPDWSPRMLPKLCDAVFGKQLAKVPAVVQRDNEEAPPVNAAPVELLARLVAHPGVALGAPWRTHAQDRVFAYLQNERGDGKWRPYSNVLAALTTSSEGCRLLWSTLDRQPALMTDDYTFLDLRGAKISDWRPLARFTDLTRLWIEHTSFDDLALLSGMKLVVLWIDHTPVQDLEPLRQQLALTSLALNATFVSDVEPLAGLVHLSLLSLSDTEVADITPLQSLDALDALFLNGLALPSLAPLTKLRKLRGLYLARSKTKLDLTPLKELPNLKTLSLYGSDCLNRQALNGKVSLKILG